MTRRAAVLWLLLVAGCVSSTDDLRGVADLPPLDRAVFVTGGAFADAAGALGTYRFEAGEEGDAPPDEAAEPEEVIAFDSIVDVLRRGQVFRRVEADPDEERRRRLRGPGDAGDGDVAIAALLEEARRAGFDLLLVVEELRDGPIENQGTNGRWPVTFVTWILLGVGCLIPDRTFESRATLRATLRDLQTGAVLHDLLLVAGPVELALTERGDLWGLLTSILVPPFFVGDDRETVVAAVRGTTERRLLLSLARDLKSEVVRRRLDEAGAASIALVDAPAGARVVVESREALSVVRLSGDGLDVSAAAAFEQAMLASRDRRAERFRYEAALPPDVRGRLVQVLVGTLRGGVASGTFVPGGRR